MNIYFHGMAARRKINLTSEEIEEIVNQWNDVKKNRTNYHPTCASKIWELHYVEGNNPSINITDNYYEKEIDKHR